MTADGLDRFLQAQENVYTQALRELRGGRKVSHWMWFILTLFALVDGADPVFASALEKYFAGERDARTIELLGRASEADR